MTDDLDRAAALLAGGLTQAGVDAYEREVIASQMRAPDYYALAKEHAKALGMTDEQYAAHLWERGLREGWLR